MEKLKIQQLPPSEFYGTIVFDLDETLIHCNENSGSNADMVMELDGTNGQRTSVGVNVRPYCRQILEELSKHFELILFTASQEQYANKILQFIDPKGRFQHRFYRDSCVYLTNGVYVKDLRVIGNRDLKVTHITYNILK